MLDIVLVIAIISIVIVGVLLAILNKETKIQYAIPAITTLGIFFTFLGIYFGLKNLDVNNIEAGLSDLLNGLKVAFLPSAVAIFIALIFKASFILDKNKIAKQNINYKENATIADILKGLDSINNNLSKSLVGDNENSLATILGNMRNENRDLSTKFVNKLEELKQVQEEALKKIAEGSSKALIEALKDVIKDFNTKLNEQFGENFKQLNNSVIKLLEWQENYKIHIETTEKTNSQICHNMQEASNKYELLVQKSETFSNVAKDLGISLQSLEQQNSNINNQLTKLSEIIIKASSDLPKIESQVLEITTQLTNSAKNHTTILQDTMYGIKLNLDNSLNNISKEIDYITTNLSSKILNNQENVNRNIDDNLQKINTNLANSIDIFNKLPNQIKASTDSLSREFSDSLKKLSEQQLKQLDESLSAELSRSLESLGKNLAQLSNRFASDYSPLTEKLRKVLEISQNINLR